MADTRMTCVILFLHIDIETDTVRHTDIHTHRSAVVVLALLFNVPPRNVPSNKNDDKNPQ